MTIADLLLIVTFLTCAALLAAGVVAATRRRWARAGRILAVVGVVLVVYFGAVVAASLVSPGAVLKEGESLCWDDWCIGVADVGRTSAAGVDSYRVTLRLSSRALRAPQRELGVVVRLVDSAGNLYEPIDGPDAAPLDVVLAPGQSTLVVRTFRLPAGAASPALVVRHRGLHPGRILIGDQESLLHRPTRLLLS